MKPLVFRGQHFLPGQALAFATACLESTSITAHERAFWQLIQNWYNPACSSFTLQTSGSTGNPKTISFSREAVVLAAEAQLKAISHLPINSAWLVLPADKAGGMMLVVRALLAGWDIWLFPNRLNPFEHFSEELPVAQVPLVSLLPSQFETIIHDPYAIEFLKKAGLVLIGGGSINANAAIWAKSEDFSQIWQSYGMTETLSFVALRNLKVDSSYFVTLPEFQVKLSESGCLAINFSEYLATAFGFTTIETHDVASLMENGQFLILGRTDEVINSGGLKLFPAILEDELEKLIGNLPFKVCVVPVVDVNWGQRPLWVFERDLPDVELLTQWSDSVDAHHRPSSWTAIESFPLNEGGKLDRRKIRLQISQ